MELFLRLRTALADRYEIRRELGRGGMSVVFLGHDIKHHRSVALKVLRPELGASLGAGRFLQEIDIAARLSHPHIVPLYDSGNVGGLLYYVMPYLDGPSLRTKLRREEHLSVDETFRLAEQVAGALSHAHANGVIHRDIKPENILLAGGEAVVTDFGIARAISAAGGDHLTWSGIPLGTLGYMSPEQAEASENIDERSDIYSLGCVVYECLLGRPPGRWIDRGGVKVGRVSGASVEDRMRLDAFPRWVEQVLVGALAQDPAERFPTAGDFADAIATRAVRRTSQYPISIAVLPFANLSPDPDNEFFSDGIAEEITNALAKVRAMRVAARTSAFHFKGQGRDIREIGQELGVATLLEGSVRKVGDRVRINVQLVGAEDGCHLWSERYERTLEDVFAMQDDIAQNVVHALRVVISDEERAGLVEPPTENVQAYEYYLRGRQYFHQFRRKSLDLARRMFQQAIAVDPDYALAHAGVADCCSFLHMYWGADPADLAQADAASRRALDLAENLAEAHAARGLALLQGGELDAAQESFERAIRIDPALYEARYFYGRVCFQQGRFELAVQLFEHAAELRDDYQPQFFVAQSLAALKRSAEAEVAYRRAHRLVERHLEYNPDDARAVTMGAVSLFRIGERARGLEWADRAVAIDADDAGVSYNVACLYALEGEHDKAFASLEQAARAGFGNREWLERDPDLEGLRSDPRFQTMLAAATPPA
jgi:TolB-like protein/Flp pilus assembly protein TadD